MPNDECPNFKSGWNGDCLYYGEEDDYETGYTIYYCKYDGEQIKFKTNCEHGEI